MFYFSSQIIGSVFEKCVQCKFWHFYLVSRSQGKCRQFSIMKHIKPESLIEILFTRVKWKKKNLENIFPVTLISLLKLNFLDFLHRNPRNISLHMQTNLTIRNSMKNNFCPLTFSLLFSLFWKRKWLITPKLHDRFSPNSCDF